MTNAQQQLEYDIARNIGTDMFNALYTFSRYKTRRGFYNRVIKLNRVELGRCIKDAKGICALWIETAEAMRKREPGFMDDLLIMLRVHYNALNDYVSTL